jgi:hypothetical protein
MSVVAPSMLAAVLALVLSACTSHAQFALQQSNTTASLRGIANVDGLVAWASGTNGTVLRTLDGGTKWIACAVPPGAEKLDFRAIQAFDEKTALVMSSGKGDLSRIYKTVDGCATWKLVFTNPDAPDGFFDAMLFQRHDAGWLLGDPVKGHFYLATTDDGGDSWTQVKTADLASPSGAGGAFAASNQSLLFSLLGPVFGGGSGAFYRGIWPGCSQSVGYNDPAQCLERMKFQRTPLPVGGSKETAGIFALNAHRNTMVAVGGDYAAPDSTAAIAAVSHNDGVVWTASTTQPHGYRSSVAYDAEAKAWITVGTNGTDVSTDEGTNWKPLTPDPAKGDTPDANKSWNALSLPFVVGPKGRIGRLREDALPVKP